MSHVSAIMKSSYPYRGSLSELDTNGDGIVSQQEVEAAQRPGLLSSSSDNSSSDRTISGVMAAIMNLKGSTADGNGTTSTLPGTSKDQPGQSGASDDADMLTARTAYRNTYGQYDLGGAAA